MNVTRRHFLFSTLAATIAAKFSSTAFAQNQKKTIALLFDGLYSTFWVAGIEILKSELAKRGFDTVEAISDRDDNKQLEQVKSMIARKVDGIIIVQTDSNAVIPAIKAANAAGIPMVHFNRPPAPNEGYSVAIQADNKSISRDAVLKACEVAKKQGGKYKACVMIGDLGDPNAVQRRDGFQEAVDQHKDIIEVVAQVPTNWNADTAFAGLTNALQANPDINFLFTSSDFMIPQEMQCLQTADKWHPIGDSKHVIFVGFDGFPQAYELLKEKYMDADGVQNLFYETELAINALVDMKAGKKPDKLLLDPGFAIGQDDLEQKKNQMWGYLLWKKEHPE